MEFSCQHCIGKTFTRLGGWKNHMSRVHGGYDEHDIATVLAQSDGTVSEDNVAARMQAFARTIPEGSDVETETPPEGETPPPPPPPERPPKTVKATPKKLKKILGSIPTKMLETKVELDEEDREALEEAGEFLTDIFGVEFEISQDKRVLHSRIWALVWVAGVALLIYIKHKYADVWAKVVETYQKQKAADKEAA